MKTVYRNKMARVNNKSQDNEEDLVGRMANLESIIDKLFATPNSAFILYKKISQLEDMCAEFPESSSKTADQWRDKVVDFWQRFSICGARILAASVGSDSGAISISNMKPQSQSLKSIAATILKSPIPKGSISKSPVPTSSISKSPIQKSPIPNSLILKSPILNGSISKSFIPKSPIPKSTISNSPILKSPISKTAPSSPMSSSKPVFLGSPKPVLLQAPPPSWPLVPFANYGYSPSFSAPNTPEARYGRRPPPEGYAKNALLYQLEKTFGQMGDIQSGSDVDAVKFLLVEVAKAQQQMSNYNSDNRLQTDVFSLAYRKLPLKMREQFLAIYGDSPSGINVNNLISFLQAEIVAQHTKTVWLMSMAAKQAPTIHSTLKKSSTPFSRMTLSTGNGSIYCKYCKTVGHVSSSCSTIKKLLCFNCYQYGHTKKQCTYAPFV